ncbi:aldo/keto reductase [Virgibacillus necropolis]|uniref:Aldo/keto reductase n=1 Tax=Virgibacillus necropolis TaxID=163877 RepID=A0A221MG49_9BACI|nr:aldo/keto reductase [Virgibacillus necropolis]ASN06636.1 aldo/keto reductase [Virgibacillus necropolis]
MDIPSLKKLSNGVSIPRLGLGVYKVPEDQVYDTVLSALDLGYRHIDTASFYGNEYGVGKAIRNSGIPREDIFVTSKVWNDDHGYDNALKAFERSMEKLSFDYLDLFLIHWPIPEGFPDTWKALEEINKTDRVGAIGVSNFLDHHLEELSKTANETPVVDQIELHPKLQQKSTVEYCRRHGIAVESWSPLGRARYLDDPLLTKMASNYDKSVAQLIIRWHLENDFIVIPKSVKAIRQKENANVFDFKLSTKDMEYLNQMNEDMRIGSHPNDMR